MSDIRIVVSCRNSIEPDLDLKEVQWKMSQRQVQDPEFVDTRPGFIKLVVGLMEFFSGICTKVKGSHRKRIRYYKLSVLTETGAQTKSIRIYYAYLLYMMAKGLLIVAAQLRLNLLVSKWNPQVRENAPFYAFCAEKDDIIDNHKDIKAEIKLYYRYLQLLGSTCSSGNDAIILGTMIGVGILCLSFYHYPLWDKYDFYLDGLTFLERPHEERIRYRKELVDELCCIVNNDTNDGNDDTTCSCKLEEQESRVDCLELIDENMDKFISNPAYLSTKGYKAFIEGQARAVRLGLIIFILTFYYTVIVQKLSEIDLRIERHLNQIKCEEWHINGTLLKDSTMINYLKPQEALEESAILKESSGIPTLKIRFIMACNLFDMFSVLTTIEASFLTFVANIWVNSQFINRTFIFLSHKIWAEQILYRLKDCTDHAIRLKNLSLMGHKDLEKKLREFEKDLVENYINFELFRKKSRENIRVMEIISGNFVSKNLAMFLLCIIYSLYTRMDSAVISFFVGLSLVSINLDFMIVIMMTNYLRKVFHQVNLLVGGSTYLSKAHIARLWRRRMISDNDAQTIYAMRPFGLWLTQSSLISLNSYAFGAALYVFQSISNRPSVKGLPYSHGQVKMLLS